MEIILDHLVYYEKREEEKRGGKSQPPPIMSETPVIEIAGIKMLESCCCQIEATLGSFRDQMSVIRFRFINPGSRPTP
jgi:hypothetical protein